MARLVVFVLSLLSFGFGWLGEAATSTEARPSANSNSHVNLVLYTEAGCGGCQLQILGPLQAMLKLDGFPQILTVKQLSFGNNYFSTSACGGISPFQPDPNDPIMNLNYDPSVRHCWAGRCVDTLGGAAPADCFGPGAIVPQHGPGWKEPNFNRMQACAQTIAGLENWQMYWDFLVCMEGAYEKAGEDPIPTAKACAERKEEEGFFLAPPFFSDDDTFDALLSCYNGPQGDESMRRVASSTSDHSFTPTILVNGAEPPLVNQWFNATAAAVCAAYTGLDPPPACAELMKTEQEVVTELEKAKEEIAKKLKLNGWIPDDA